MSKRPECNPQEDAALVKEQLLRAVGLPLESQIATITALYLAQGTFSKADMWRLQKSLAEEKKKSEYQECISQSTNAEIELPAGVIIPPEYQQGNSELFRRVPSKLKKGDFYLEKISNATVVVSEKTRNIITGEVGVKLWFVYDGKPKTIIVSQDVVASTAKILDLAKFGVPVNSTNAIAVVGFLSDQQHASMPTIKETKITNQPGWGMDDAVHIFANGCEVYHPDGLGIVQRESSPSGVTMTEAYGCSGDAEEWFEQVRWAKAFPAALFMLGTAFAAPLLELVGVPNFMVHVWNDSSEGKSSVLQIALSVFGKPTKNGLLQTWRITANGLEARAKQSNSSLACFDELKQAPNEDVVAGAAYLIANGALKGRATRTGDARAGGGFSTIGISSGETPLSGENSLAGIEVRYIDMHTLVFGAKNAEIGKRVRELKEALEKNYGHAAARYLPELVKIANCIEKLEALREEFCKIRKDLSAGVIEPFLQRTVDYFAIVKIGLVLCMRLFPELALTEEEITKAISFVFSLQKDRLKKDNGVDVRALRYLWDKILGNEGRFYEEHPDKVEKDIRANDITEAWGRKSERKRADGKWDSGYAFLPTMLSKVLSDGGFDFKATVDFLKKRGCIWLDDNGQLHTVKIAGHPTRVYVFDEAKAYELGALHKVPEATKDQSQQQPQPPSQQQIMKLVQREDLEDII